MTDMTKKWHMDVKFAISIIGALLLQAAALIVWGARLDLVVGRHDRDITALQTSVQTVTEQVGTTNGKLGEIKTAQDYQLRLLQDVRDDVRAITTTTSKVQ